MEKKYEAIFSIKMESHKGEEIKGEINIEGDINGILNALKGGLITLLDNGIVSKKLLHIVVDMAFEESTKSTNTEDSEQEDTLHEALKGAPQEVKEIIGFLKETGLI